MKEYKELDQDEKREYRRQAGIKHRATTDYNGYMRQYQKDNRVLKTYYWKYKNGRIHPRHIEEERIFTTLDKIYIEKMNNKLLTNK